MVGEADLVSQETQAVKEELTFKQTCVGLDSDMPFIFIWILFNSTFQFSYICFK